MWGQWWGLVCQKADWLAGWHLNTNQVIKLNISSQQKNLKPEFHYIKKEKTSSHCINIEESSSHCKDIEETSSHCINIE